MQATLTGEGLKQKQRKEENSRPTWTNQNTRRWKLENRPFSNNSFNSGILTGAVQSFRHCQGVTSLYSA